MPRSPLLLTGILLGLLSASAGCDYYESETPPRPSTQELEPLQPDPTPDPIVVRQQRYRADWTSEGIDYAFLFGLGERQDGGIDCTWQCVYRAGSSEQIVTYAVRLSGTLDGDLEGARLQFETPATSAHTLSFDGTVEAEGTRLIGTIEGTHHFGAYGPIPVTFVRIGP